VGITKDVLDVIAHRGWLVRGVEVIWHQIYLDIPSLQSHDFTAIQTELLTVPGVHSVQQIDLLPGERRQRHFDVLLGALAEPVLAVDPCFRVVAANTAATRAFRIPEEHIDSHRGLRELFDAETSSQLLAQLERFTGGEVSILGRPMLMDVLPLSPRAEDDDKTPYGAILLFRAPNSLGQDLSSISKRELASGTPIIGESSAMRQVTQLIERFGPISAPLLITGETGTGKELVARACHRASRRSGMPFLALNCAALPENLAESELFGYAPGAFSGAQKNGKPGLFELANGGTVFLDEIGEMSLYLQAKLLRFLQDGTFVRIGGKVETKVDLRLLTATHRDLKEMVRIGAFREDLYYRLHVLTIRIPPLRERREDIAPLSRYFVMRAAMQIGANVKGIRGDALRLIEANDWPGNARQLENALFRAVSLAEGDELTVDDVLPMITADEQSGSMTTPAAHPESGDRHESHAQAMGRAEKEMLTRLFSEYPSSRKLAQRLGLSHTAVANKLRKHGIPGRGRAGPPEQ